MAGAKSHLLFFSALAALSTILFLLTGCGAGANSSPPSFLLIVTAPAAGTGTVTSSPSGINCPPSCAANFSRNTQVRLTAIPGTNHTFAGWGGACSGTSTCILTMIATDSVTATFAAIPAGGDAPPSKHVIAYIFTPDAMTLTTSEFALLANGQLQATKNTVQPWLMAGTAHGLVMDLPKPDSDWATGNLQSYAVKSDGSLQPQGSPVSIPIQKYASSLASDNTYVYAVSDEGIFGFEDTSGGLIPLPPIQETVPRPCTSAQENAGDCSYSGSLRLGNTSAFFTEIATWQFGTPSLQLSSFVRSQGQLTAEQLLSQSPPSVQAIVPNFAYALTNGPSATFISLCTITENFTCTQNVLSNGESVSDGFAQLLVSANGLFLFAVVFDGAEAPRVRVFQINPSTGTLAEVPDSPFLTGQYYFQFAALDPSGHFLLVLSASCDGSGPCTTPGKLAAMRINSTTGALTVTSDVDDGQYPYNIFAVAISQ